MSKTAFLLIGHGSRNAQANAGVYQLAELVSEQLPSEQIEVAFMEVSEPSIEQVCLRLSETGITHIVALPVMLMAAGHVQNDLPSILESVERELPVTIRFIPGLSVSQNIISAAKSRIDEACIESIGDGTTALIVVGSGSSIEGAGDNLAKLASGLGKELNCTKSLSCFTGIAKPDLRDAVESVKEHCQKVIVFPCFLFSGFLSNKVALLAKEIDREIDGIQFILAEPFNCHTGVVSECVELLVSAKEEIES